MAAASRESALRSELQQLPDAEAAKIAELLGLSSGAQPPLLSRQNQPPGRPVALPLVWKNVDLTALNLNSNQVQVINELRQSFANEIGGPNQNPDDPAYLERWQKAQPEVDEMLRGMLGNSVFQDYQIAIMENNE